MDAVDDRARTRLTAPAAIAGEVRAAVTFLTRVPLAGTSAATGAAAFGIVGAGIGLAAAVVLVLASPAAALPAAVLSVATLALVSGGLHLDGLADTADALAAPDAARAEAARLDPRAGPAGVATLVLVVALDATLIAQLAATSLPVAVAALIVAAAGSRASAAAAPRIARGRVSGGRSGARFVERTTPGESWVALGCVIVLAVLASAVVGSSAVAFGAIGGLVVAAIAAEWLTRRRGGLDGDGIGTIVEIACAAILLLTVAIERSV
jgi:adenosylcobinamide-GDP ribazoletransferase